MFEFRKRAKITDPEVRLRMPRDLIKMIDHSAERNGRSRNSEILQRLSQTFFIKVGD